jgi:hypothetical protein
MRDVEQKFRLRAKGVRAYLRSLTSLESMHSSPGSGLYRAQATLAVSRASAFIMIYNCVEFAFREAMKAIRDNIKDNAPAFVGLNGFWREEIVEHRFYDKLQNGVNFKSFLKEVAAFAPGTIDWRNNAKTPFGGNIDHTKITDFSRAMGCRWKIPRAAWGGADLELVKRIRNELAHGEETFENVGSNYTTLDVIEKFDRIRAYMTRFLQAVGRYVRDKKYLLT